MAVNTVNNGVNSGPSVTSGSTATSGSYQIKSGDSLYQIAEEYGIGLAALEALNPQIANPSLIYPGQTVTLPTGAEPNGKPAPSTPGSAIAPPNSKDIAPPNDKYIAPPNGKYVQIQGPEANFPKSDKWTSYDQMWANDSKIMANVGDSPAEIQAIKDSIEKEATATGLDHRIILATIMQESNGNVRVGTTNNGVRNPGLMQSHNGVTFNPADPAGSIAQMIKDGVEGTADGPGIASLIQQNGVFKGLRMYNSGSAIDSDLSNGNGATASYCADIANRLMGNLY